MEGRREDGWTSGIREGRGGVGEDERGQAVVGRRGGERVEWAVRILIQYGLN